ncbi:hypothetical protein H2203_000333 [Taxawa tesnikishii (nom. ined.)]|nr:hypothetical protein H2203_000333 [Dothideales sp. JES 119]
MGIHGIYKEIGPGRRVALSKLSVEHYIQHSRPFRLAIDISIWLFQIQSGKGGSNPALRTFYYRLLRLLSLNIHPLFVFDGPNKPLFKRNKRVGGPGVRVSSIPEFLAKQLLKQFGFPMHNAPGEAEAECALLQREGIVDAVLSEDVDTLMFGSGVTLRNWSSEQRSSKVPTHVNLYDAAVTKEGSGLDREGMILVALMSGGDYIPEGIPGCGPKLACEAARAGFGADLCKIKRKDEAGFKAWRERLQHELRTNESKLFKQKRKALVIPEDFPNIEVLGYYTHPVISGPDKLARLRETLKWDMPIDYPALRSFTADAFDWRCLGGAKKFIRNLAPALLVRELRLRSENDATDLQDDLTAQEAAEARLVTAIHGKRTHATTDSLTEVRISFTPINLVDIDLSIEEPDEELSSQAQDSDDDVIVAETVEDHDNQCPGSPRKQRGPSTYDPTVLEKIWIVDTFLKLGAPLKVQDWEASFRDHRQYLAAKQAAKNVGKQSRAKKVANKATGGMQKGALDQYAKHIKPGISSSQPLKAKSPEFDEVDLTAVNEFAASQPTTNSAPRAQTQPRLRKPATIEEVDLTAASGFTASQPVGKGSAQARQRVSKPGSTRDAVEEVDLSGMQDVPSPPRRPKRRSAELTSPKVNRQPASHPTTRPPEIIELLSSPENPPSRPLSPLPPVTLHGFEISAQAVTQPDFCPSPLPDSVTKRRRRSPLKRHESAPTAGEDPPMPTPPSRPYDSIEVLDLASPLLQISSPLFVSPSLAPVADVGNTRDSHVMPGVMRASELASPSRPPPPKDIVEWIRRSQSATPSKARHADFLGNAASKAVVDVQITSSIPTPPMEEGEVDPIELELDRPGLTEFLPAARRLRERQPVASPAPRPDPAAQSSTHTDLRAGARGKVRPSPKPGQGGIGMRSSPKLIGKQIKKRHIQIRQSLEGAWKETEEVDLAGSSPVVITGIRTRWRLSEVEVLDMTGDD